MKIHKATWIDASGGGNVGWRSIDELVSTKPAKVISCGIILREDDISITICPHFILDEEGQPAQGDAEIVIPKQWLLSCDLINCSYI